MIRNICAVEDHMSEQYDWPSVSVIIVTKGNHELAVHASQSVIAVDYPKDKLQVVIIEETDTPTPILGNCVEYHAIPIRNLGVGYARNHALQYVKNRMVVFTDDDCIVEKTWMKQLIKPLLDSDDTVAVAGLVLVPECGAVGQCENILGFPGGGVKYLHNSKGDLMAVPTFSTCNCAINTKLVPPIRFKEDFQYAGEDELLSRDISRKHTIVYNPCAIVYHSPRDGLAAVFRWFYRRGQARVEMTKHVQEKKKYIWHHILTSQIFRFASLLSICLVFRLSLVPALVILVFLYYFSIIYRFSWAWRYYSSIRTMLLLPVVRFLMDLGIETGSLRTIFQKLKRK